MRQIQIVVPTLLGLALVLGGGREADGSTGTLDGRLRFHNRNGGYCPGSATCTGALYKHTDYNTFIAIPEVSVQILRASDNVVIGTGSTGSDGKYLITWTSGAGTANVSGKLRVLWRHKNGRFQFHRLANILPAHIQYYTDSMPFTLTHGTTAVSPQTNLTSWTYGTTSEPHQIANLYWAAWKMWSRLSSSMRMTMLFQDLDILAFEAPPNGVVKTNVQCATTSCAMPAAKNLDLPARPTWAEKKLTIVLDGGANTPYMAMTRMMHEMGHIADFLSGPSGGLVRSTGFCYGGEVGNCPWSLWSNEYRPTALTEGLATFIAATAFYDNNAATPYACGAYGNGTASFSHCYPGTSLQTVYLETRIGACLSLEGRRPSSAMRYFWDLYDTPADGTDASTMGIANIFDSLSYWPCPGYPACYGTAQLHDQFTSVDSALYLKTPNASQLDEGSAARFRDNMQLNCPLGYNTAGAYNQNCMGTF